MKFNLNHIKMNVITTASSGVVNQDTLFVFSQSGNRIQAEYSGGKIDRGFLVGRFLDDQKLIFAYCQVQLDGSLDNGTSTCDLAMNESGKIQLIEHFEWKSRPGEKGTNIFQEL